MSRVRLTSRGFNVLCWSLLIGSFLLALAGGLYGGAR